jgi:hypothetical protein
MKDFFERADRRESNSDSRLNGQTYAVKNYETIFVCETIKGLAQTDIFNCIEMFYNVKPKHGSNNLLSPVNFEKQHQEQLASI